MAVCPILKSTMRPREEVRAPIALGHPHPQAILQARPVMAAHQAAEVLVRIGSLEVILLKRLLKKLRSSIWCRFIDRT